MEEKKVVYSVTRYSKNGDYRYHGIGKLKGKDLHTWQGKVFEDVVKHCTPIAYKQNEFKGYYDEFQEIEVETKNGSYETIEVNTEYKVWYKFI